MLLMIVCCVSVKVCWRRAPPITPVTIHPTITITDNHQHHTLQPLQRASSLTHSSLSLLLRAMPYVKKEEWIRRLKEQGENPPPSCTVAQLQGRYAEIMERQEAIEPQKGLEEAIKAMKKASRQKKAEFQRFLDEQGVSYGKTDTVQQLACKAEEQITMVRGHRSELMGFGRHGALTMREVMEDHGAYAQWCRTTMAEEDTSWRMRRFVMYAEKYFAEKKMESEANRNATKIPENPSRKPSGAISQKHNAAKADGYKNELRAGDAKVADQRLLAGDLASHRGRAERSELGIDGGSGGDCQVKGRASADGERRGRAGESDGEDQGPEGDVRDLPDKAALVLAKTWQPQRNPLSAKWPELAHFGRPLLFELACFEDSALSQEVENRFGKGSAIRGGLFNGCDLSSSKGVAMAKFLVKKHRPGQLSLRPLLSVTKIE